MNNGKGPDLRLVDPPAADAPQRPDGVFWDKAAPTTPPQQMKRGIPKHLEKIAEFLGNIVTDEAFLLDLCLDKATSIVEFNCKKRMVGIDLIGAEGQMHPFNTVAAATPLAIELYKQALAGVLDRKDEYAALLEAAQEEAHRGKTPTIHLP